MRAVSHSSHRDGSLAMRSKIVAIAEGPATKGVARGTIKGSPSGVSPNIFSEPRKIIFKAIIKSMIPPAMLSDGPEISKNPRIYRPVKRNETRTTRAMSISRKIIFLCFLESTFLRIAKNSGTFPKGSITRNSNTAAENKVIIIF